MLCRCPGVSSTKGFAMQHSFLFNSKRMNSLTCSSVTDSPAILLDRRLLTQESPQLSSFAALG